MGRQLCIPISVCDLQGDPRLCVLAAVDTGAESVSLPERLMGALDIEPRMCRPQLVNGAGDWSGTWPVTSFPVELHVAGFRVWDYVLFSPGEQQSIIGQNFLRYFRLVYDISDEYVGLEPKDGTERLPQRAPFGLSVPQPSSAG